MNDAGQRVARSKFSVAAARPAASTVGACALAGALAVAIAGCGQKGPLKPPQSAASAASAGSR